MTKSELIKKLNEFPDEMQVRIFDWRKNLNEDNGSGSSAGVYSFEVVSEKLSEDEKTYFESQNGREYRPWIQLSFDNNDYTDEGSREY